MGTASSVVASRQFPGKLYLGLGIGLVFLGLVLCVAQFAAKFLFVPWYLPALATAGSILLFIAVVQRPAVGRIIALVLCGLLASAEWYFLLALCKLPVYMGPVVIGTAFPAFTTTLADGSTFDQSGLRGEQHTAMVFFRGRG